MNRYLALVPAVVIALSPGTVLASGFIGGGGGGGGGGAPTGPAGGDLGSSFPNPTVLSVSNVNTGLLAVARGGTHLASYAVGDVLYASGATTIAKLADVATGQVLVSGGVGAAPAYSASPSLTALILATALAVASGGTGIATVGSNGVFAAPAGGSTGAPAFRMPVAADLGAVSWTGDVQGTGASPTVARLQGVDVSTTLPGANQVLTFTSGKWAPATPSGGGSTPSLAAVLAVGATTGGTSVTVSSGDKILSASNTALTLLAQGTGQITESGRATATFATASTVTMLNATDTTTFSANRPGGGISFNAAYRSDQAITTLASISGIKENTTDSNTHGALIFGVNDGSSGLEVARFSSEGKFLLGTQSPLGSELLRVAGATQLDGNVTIASGTLGLAGDTVSGTPAWSSSQAITLSTAAQPNITSLGTIASLVATRAALGVHASSTGTTTIDATATYWPCDTTSAGFTATLPTPVGISGVIYVVKKTSSDSNTLTVGTAAGNIDGSSTITTTTQNASFSFISDGTNWKVW